MEGKPIGAVLTLHDDTARVHTELALREESQALETLNRVGATVASELELERIVQTVTDAGVALIGAHRHCKITAYGRMARRQAMEGRALAIPRVA